MFTGLIEEIGIITELQKQESRCRYGIRGKKIFTNLKLGDSISVNGVCLTVSARNKLEFQADVMNETLSRSTMNGLKVGSRVNLERAMAVGDRFGGHMVTGHVDGTGIITKRLRDGNAIRYVVQTEEEICKCMVEKGSVAMDGISLTIVSVSEKEFSVSVIPHTEKETILCDKREGDSVNIETDIIGKYAKKLFGISEKEEKSKITMEFLCSHGF